MPRAKALPRHKPYADMTLDDVRALVRESREEGLRIQSHYKRLEEEYSNWEDQINEIENIITQMQEDTGIKREEIIIPASEEKTSLLDELMDM